MNTGIESLEEVSTRRRKKSSFQKVNNWLHLWLGLASGIIVFIVCITAAVWVFSEEITYLTEPSIRAQIRQDPGAHVAARHMAGGLDVIDLIAKPVRGGQTAKTACV